MKELDELNFMECAACRGKPGSPQLCESCLNNRAVIYRLKRGLGGVAEVEGVVMLLGRSLEAAKVALGYPKRCVCKKPWFENPECKVHGR